MRLLLAALALFAYTVTSTARPYATGDRFTVAWDNIGGIDIEAGQSSLFVCGWNADC